MYHAWKDISQNVSIEQSTSVAYTLRKPSTSVAYTLKKRWQIGSIVSSIHNLCKMRCKKNNKKVRIQHLFFKRRL